jgi:heptosyltransferase-2
VDLGIYAALAERAAVVIANDSGSSHVAAAVGARQVTIFGVTDRSRTGPWSPRAVCVGHDGHWPDVGEVVAALDQALALP